MFEFLAATALVVVVGAQAFDVRTTKTLLALGGYERNKLIRKLQKWFPHRWGTIKLGVAVAVLAAAEVAFGPIGMIVVSIPIIGVSVKVIKDNRSVIRRLAALRQNDG